MFHFYSARVTISADREWRLRAPDRSVGVGKADVNGDEVGDRVRTGTGMGVETRGRTQGGNGDGNENGIGEGIGEARKRKEPHSHCRRD